jgi:ubiquinone/menaquinone biosynthesis C-methylase UbiE
MPATTANPMQEYILGVDEQESARLGLQHRLWSASAHEAWERARLQPGLTVLDVGCGPGYATIDMAHVVGPRGRLIAVDESPLYLKHLHDRAQGQHVRNVQRMLGDVQQLDALLPGAGGAVDFAYARWVLCFVADPEAVVRGVSRLLKPGGRFVIQDYFNYEAMSLAPRRDAFSRVIRAVASSWRDKGGDPDIMSRLPALCRRHGLEVTDLRCNERIARPGEMMWHWPDSFWSSFVPRLVEMGYLSAAERDAFDACWAEASADPDTFMFLPPVFDLIAVKR